MSNASLVENVQAALLRLQKQETRASDLAEAVANNGRALEAMPYAMVKEMEQLAWELELAAFADDLPNYELQDVIARLQVWLSKVPL